MQGVDQRCTDRAADMNEQNTAHLKIVGDGDEARLPQLIAVVDGNAGACTYSQQKSVLVAYPQCHYVRSHSQQLHCVLHRSAPCTSRPAPHHANLYPTTACIASRFRGCARMQAVRSPGSPLRSMQLRMNTALSSSRCAASITLSCNEHQELVRAKRALELAQMLLCLRHTYTTEEEWRRDAWQLSSAQPGFAWLGRVMITLTIGQHSMHILAVGSAALDIAGLVTASARAWSYDEQTRMTCLAPSASRTRASSSSSAARMSATCAQHEIVEKKGQGR